MISERSVTKESPNGSPHIGVTTPDGERDRPNDLFRRVAHVLLAVYLLPALLIVLLVSGIAMVVTGLMKVVTRVFGGRRAETSLVGAGLDESPQPLSAGRVNAPGRHHL